MVDWKKLYDEWDKVPDDLKRKIEGSFREKTVEKLNLLFIQEPAALRLYEKVIGAWIKPVPGIEVDKLLREAKPIAATMPKGPYKSDFEAMIAELERRIISQKPAIMPIEVEHLKEWMEKFRPAAPPAMPPIPEEGITEEWLEAVKKFSPEVKPEVDVHTDFTYSVYLNKWIGQLKDDVPMGIMPLKTPPEVEEFLAAGEFDGWKWRPEGVTRPPEYLEAKGIWEATYLRGDLEALTREEVNKVARIKGFSVTGKKEDVVDRILGAPPVVPPAAPLPVGIPTKYTIEELRKRQFPEGYIKEIEEGVRNRIEEYETGYVCPEDGLSVKFAVWPDFVCANGHETNVNLLKRREEYKPPEVPPAVVPPGPPARVPARAPPRPPTKPPLVPVVGLAKADEEALSDMFLSRLMEGTLSPGAARGHLPEFRILLASLRTELQKEARDRAVALARSDVEKLASDIVARKPPTVRPPVVPMMPPEEVPPVVFPIVAPAPPPSAIRLYGMPWTYEKCTVCLGEVAFGQRRLEDVHVVLRSRYLEMRLRRIGIPTTDPIFYELCQEEHKKGYGGVYEYFPRDRIEFWVGEVMTRGEMDIAELVNMGISEQYCLYAESFYRENKHLIPLRPGEDPNGTESQ